MDAAPTIQMPSNQEAEQALLAALLIRNDVLERVPFLRAEHFALGVHGRIFAACVALIERGQVASPVTLKGYFDQDGALAEIGGAAYLARLVTSVVTIVNAATYGRTIYDCWLRRALIGGALETIEHAQAFELGRDARTLLEEVEARTYALAELPGGSGPRSVADLAGAHVADVEAAYRAGGVPLGLPTGIRALDHIMGGMQDGELIVLGGRPNLGKSLCAGRIAWNVARREPAVPAYIFSLEQTARLWVSRWIASTTGITTDLQYRGDLDQASWQRFIGASAALGALPLHVDDQCAVTVGQIRAQARHLMRRHGKGLIVVDHLGLVRGSPAAERDGMIGRVSEVSAALKGLAKELNCPVLALCQLNRQLEVRDDKRPQLSDLRQSGTIEQDADVVLFIYRHSYYLERNPPLERQGETPAARAGRMADWEAELSRHRNLGELIVSKNRHGPTGIAHVYVDPATAVVMDVKKDEEQGM